MCHVGTGVRCISHLIFVPFSLQLDNMLLTALSYEVYIRGDNEWRGGTSGRILSSDANAKRTCLRTRICHRRSIVTPFPDLELT